jgi:TolA-binding protein
MASKWRALAEAGRYREALAAAEAVGFEGECQRASSADLLSLAGAARLTGDAAHARQAYSLLRKRYASEPVAAVAAFNLARVAFDLASDYAGAARWFRTYLREQPSGSLAPEAHGRLLEALQRSGDTAGARAAANEYLTRYPAGPHAEFAKRLAR